MFKPKALTVQSVFQSLTEIAKASGNAVRAPSLRDLELMDSLKPKRLESSKSYWQHVKGMKPSLLSALSRASYV